MKMGQTDVGDRNCATGGTMGVTSASLIVIIVVGAVVGAIVGGILGAYVPAVAVALGAGIIATAVAALVRNKLVNRLSGAGPDQGRIPGVVAMFGVIGSIAGSLAAKELLDQAGGAYNSVWLGTVAGLASAVMVALLLITYHMYPAPSR